MAFGICHLLAKEDELSNLNAFYSCTSIKGGEGISLVTVTVTSVCRFKDISGSCTLKLSAVISLLSYYASQKKTFEINPRHPLIKDMLRRVKVNKYSSETLADLAAYNLL